MSCRARRSPRGQTRSDPREQARIPSLNPAGAAVHAEACKLHVSTKRAGATDASGSMGSVWLSSPASGDVLSEGGSPGDDGDDGSGSAEGSASAGASPASPVEEQAAIRAASANMEPRTIRAISTTYMNAAYQARWNSLDRRSLRFEWMVTASLAANSARPCATRANERRWMDGARLTGSSQNCVHFAWSVGSAHRYRIDAPAACPHAHFPFNSPPRSVPAGIVVELLQSKPRQ